MDRSISYRLKTTISPAEARSIGVVVIAELALVAVYFRFTGATLTHLRYAVYPFIWINVGLWAVLKTTPPPVQRRHRWVGVIAAMTYFSLLAIVAGLIGIHPGHSPHPDGAFGLQIVMGAPGWGPAVMYISPSFHCMIIPYLVIGYLSLAYLVYVTVLEATRSAVAGLLGIGSCIGCTFPVAASFVAGVAGGSSALTTAIYGFSMDISTGVFVAAIMLLYWRPGFDEF